MVDRLVEGGRIERPSTEAALRAVPRHEFVSVDVERAYRDRPLRIGAGQTVSAPHAVAWMLDALALEAGDRVLEVGTGCGYHAAVTAAVVGPENLFSVEYDPDLAREARDRLDRLGDGAVSLRVGDGREGWPAHAPYDAAYLTCAVPELPPAVVEQVREGGRVLAPVGRDRQRLVLGHVRADGLDRESLGGVRFVRVRG
jgi:protein-L-isoaspartate(D-aspartate) O-methyltransferase